MLIIELFKNPQESKKITTKSVPNCVLGAKETNEATSNEKPKAN